MSDVLLDVVSFRDLVQKNQGIPAMLEFPFEDRHVPYLVSSSRSVLWVDSPSSEGFLRAATRPTQGLSEEIVATIVERSIVDGWGNVQPLTSSGLESCLEFLIDKGLKELEVIASPTVDPELLDPTWNVVWSRWVPAGTVIFLPKDRSYLGTFGAFGNNIAVAVVHNASKAIAIAFDDAELVGDLSEEQHPERGSEGLPDGSGGEGSDTPGDGGHDL